MSNVTKIKPASGIASQAPAFLKEAAGEGMEELKHIVRPPRLKVVQKMSRKPFSDLFKAGDVVAVPQMQLVVGLGEVFHFVPLLQYLEWCVWNPLDTRGTLKTIRDRTLDPKSEIAIIARDPNKRGSKPCPEMPEKDGKKLFLDYREHINFMWLLLPPVELGVAELPVAVSFSKGEWQAGSNFGSLLAQRNLRVTPIYGCQFAAASRERQGQKGDWHGLTVDNPAEDSGVTPFVQDEERFKFYQSLHREFATALKAKQLELDYEDVEEEIDAKNNKDF
jgi:hypothetical protein